MRHEPRGHCDAERERERTGEKNATMGGGYHRSAEGNEVATDDDDDESGSAAGPFPHRAAPESPGGIASRCSRFGSPDDAYGDDIEADTISRSSVSSAGEGSGRPGGPSRRTGVSNERAARRQRAASTDPPAPAPRSEGKGPLLERPPPLATEESDALRIGSGTEPFGLTIRLESAQDLRHLFPIGGTARRRRCWLSYALFGVVVQTEAFDVDVDADVGGREVAASSELSYFPPVTDTFRLRSSVPELCRYFAAGDNRTLSSLSVYAVCAEGTVAGSAEIDLRSLILGTGVDEEPASLMRQISGEYAVTRGASSPSAAADITTRGGARGGGGGS